MDRGDDTAARRRRLVEAIRDDRASEAAGPTRFEAGGHVVAYDDQQLRLNLDEAASERLEDLLSSYRVFKVAQPETRRADGGGVYLSAVTDAKHTADFVEALFREVFEADEDYELRVR